MSILKHPLSKCLIVIFFVGIASLSSVAYSEEYPYNTNLIIPWYEVSGTRLIGDKPNLFDDKIAYLWSHENSSAIWLFNITTRQKQLLYVNSSIDSYFTGPKFSPDGNKIIFCTFTVLIPGEKGERTISVLVKNGTRWDHTCKYEILYKNNGTMINNPSYSLNGTKIVYASVEGGGDGDVWAMDANGTNRTRLTYDRKGGDYPSFSPDGSKIIYMPFGPGGNYELWIMGSDGDNKKRLLDESWYPNEACFTPDGRILFTSARVSPHSSKLEDGNIWMMGMDGNNKMLIVPTRFHDDVFSKWPAMSKDGTMIVFGHGLGKCSGLHYVTDPTSEWRDSDGDGVWDGIDCAPYDPNAGYIKDEPSGDWLTFLSLNILIMSTAVVAVVIGVAALIFLLSRRKK